MHRALAGIPIEHRTVGSGEPLSLSDQVAAHGHQPVAQRPGVVRLEGLTPVGLEFRIRSLNRGLGHQCVAPEF